jgi:hypothetical protein
MNTQRRIKLALLASAGCLMTALSGCHRGADADVAPAAATATANAADSVVLKPDEVAKMGIATTPAQAAMHTPEAAGYGTVVAHDSIAQAVAELQTAAAVERQSRAARDRGSRLAGTPGALPLETQEGAQRQAVVDQAALELAKRRLSSTFGLNPPWKTNFASPELAALASGRSQLVRVTFPLGALADQDPHTLRFLPLNGAAGARGWRSTVIWRAPADASVPGKSFFAVLPGGDVGEGERLLAWAPFGAADAGVEVPAAATVISGGRYWCYVETKPGVFVRTEIDASMPTDNGYFVKDGVSPGDQLVTTSAGQLLAREMNPGAAAD